jgi:hypothetical protein
MCSAPLDFNGFPDCYKYCGASHLQYFIAFGEMELILIARCYNTLSPTAKWVCFDRPVLQYLIAYGEMGLF